MNEQLQAALLSILNSTINAATAAKNFLVAEVPDVIHQLLVWKAVQSGLGFVLGLALMGAAILAGRKSYTRSIESEYGSFEFVLSLIAGFGGVVGLVFCANNLEWLQILVAPKIYLIEYAASLARSVK